jgi:hypothetical protein
VQLVVPMPQVMAPIAPIPRLDLKPDKEACLDFLRDLNQHYNQSFFLSLFFFQCEEDSVKDKHGFLFVIFTASPFLLSSLETAAGAIKRYIACISILIHVASLFPPLQLWQWIVSAEGRFGAS